MQLYKKLNLPYHLVNELQSSARQEMAGLNLSSGQIHFLAEPTRVLNMYLAERNITILARQCMLFHRPANFPQALHIDCNNEEPPQLIKCAINIPIENCEDSYMEWYHGTYTTRVNSATGLDNKVRKFIELDWQGQPELLDRVIINEPTLVSTMVPHKVTVIDRTRSLITLRFFNNPEFDDIAKLF